MSALKASRSNTKAIVLASSQARAIAKIQPQTPASFRRKFAAIAAPSPRPFLPLPPAAIQALRSPAISPAVSESDESYFKYTSGRWLYNEQEQMAQRYTRFDVAALHRVIFKVCGSPVVNMEKKEGLFNKSFMCTLANGNSITARIKNPIAGPAHRMTASEVATMDFVRNYLGLPAPQVLSWSSKAASNGVGAEYIIMETIKGEQLADCWDFMDLKRKKAIVGSLIETEQKLLNAKFSHFGSLYYKEDVPEDERAPTLFADPNRPKDGSETRFCIGPIAHRNWYEAERADLKISRGPWANAEDYLKAIAEKEEAWISEHGSASLHDDPFRTVVGPLKREEHLSTLKQYRQVVPALVPESSKSLESVIWHPDLNPGNIFVSGDKVSGIIDWQGAWSGPAYLQMIMPSFLAYQGADLPFGSELPTLPTNFERLSPMAQTTARNNHRAQLLHKLYEIKQLLPVQPNEMDTRLMAVRAAGRTWKDGVLPMKLALLDVYSTWKDLSRADEPCPIMPTAEEVETLVGQRDRYLSWHDLLGSMQNNFGMRLYGWVPPAEYDAKHKLLHGTRDKLPETLTAEMDSLMPEKAWWPFRDTL